MYDSEKMSASIDKFINEWGAAKSIEDIKDKAAQEGFLNHPQQPTFDTVRHQVIGMLIISKALLNN